HSTVSPGSLRPSWLLSTTFANFTSSSAGLSGRGTVAVDGGEVTELPPGTVPVAGAVLDTEPASKSAWVNTWRLSAVHVVDAPGASVVAGQLIEPARGSCTATRSVRCPVFVTRNVHATSSPTSTTPLWLASITVACFARLIAGGPANTGMTRLASGELTWPP